MMTPVIFGSVPFTKSRHCFPTFYKLIKNNTDFKLIPWFSILIRFPPLHFYNTVILYYLLMFNEDLYVQIILESYFMWRVVS